MKNLYKSNGTLIFILSLIPLLLHLFSNAFANYGYFRDELYYIACSNRLAAGYVDQPPFSIFILALNRFLFGDSVFALRLIPAINSALTVLVTCLMTKKMGGGKSALVISSVAVIFAPVYLGINTIYSMNSFDILLWSLAFYFIILIIENNRLSEWIVLGIVLGIGLLNKIGFLWLCFGFFAGLILTDHRKVFLSVKPYLCAVIAIIIFSPFIIWNIDHDFAHLEFIRNASSDKNALVDVKDFIKGQILTMNPASVLVWLPGLIYFLFDRSGKKFRIIGIIYISTFLILVFNSHSKAEYLSPAYTVLFAGGGVLIERFTSLRFKWLRYLIVSVIVILGLIITPLALPVLPVEAYIQYSHKLGLVPSSAENKKLGDLPQFYADMFGWEKLAQDISSVYLSLPEDERINAVVFGRNYGEASAIEFFSKKYPLPQSISGHNSYWIWGYPENNISAVIVIGGNKEELLKIFENVEQAAIHTAEYSMPYENNLPIYIAKNPKVSLDKTWKELKHFN